MELVHIMLQTLIEMSVANIDNQEDIYNSRVIMDVLNAILQLCLYNGKECNEQYDIEHVSDFLCIGKMAAMSVLVGSKDLVGGWMMQ